MLKVVLSVPAVIVMLTGVRFALVAIRDARTPVPALRKLNILPDEENIRSFRRFLSCMMALGIAVMLGSLFCLVTFWR